MQTFIEGFSCARFSLCAGVATVTKTDLLEGKTDNKQTDELNRTKTDCIELCRKRDGCCDGESWGGVATLD